MLTIVKRRNSFDVTPIWSRLAIAEALERGVRSLNLLTDGTDLDLDVANVLRDVAFKVDQIWHEVTEQMNASQAATFRHSGMMMTRVSMRDGRLTISPVPWWEPGQERFNYDWHASTPRG